LEELPADFESKGRQIEVIPVLNYAASHDVVWEVEYIILRFTFSVDGDESSASRLKRFIPEERAPETTRY
jgi:hypothetical protein